jgi:hypothetical protein
MVLQSTGAISLANIQTEFGGANPIGLNEYYLNGVYTTGTGAVGIPTSGQISFSQFYGKSKVVASSWPPTAVQSSYGNFGLPWGLGSTYYEWQAGASGTNLTRTGGTTFNNLGADNYQNRPNFINYQNLILQAKPGDTVRFTWQTTALYGDYEVASVLLHLGGGWFVVSSQGSYGSRTNIADYTISASQAVGSYGIAFYCDYSSAGSSSYSSANFYSLHIAN